MTKGARIHNSGDDDDDGDDRSSYDKTVRLRTGDDGELVMVVVTICDADDDSVDLVWKSEWVKKAPKVICQSENDYSPEINLTKVRVALLNLG